jgi:hypothetical protein
LLDPNGLPRGWTTAHPANVRVIREPAPRNGEPSARNGEPGPRGGVPAPRAGAPDPRGGEPGPRGHVVQFTGDAELMGGYGVDLLSPPIVFKPNTRYRCTGLTRSAGPSLMIFVKGYATVTRRVDGQVRTFDDQVYQMRKEVKPTAEWTSFNLDFELRPTDVFSDQRHTLKYLRVKLWGYWPAGTCWLDDIRFEEVGPLPASDQRDPNAVTHMVVPPTLGPEARRPEGSAGGGGGNAASGAGDTHGAPDAGAGGAPGGLDLEGEWNDAVNLFQAGRYAEAWPHIERLLSAASDNADYRVLAARCLLALNRLDDAEKHAAWVLKAGDAAQAPGAAPETDVGGVQAWHRDWARIVQLDVRYRRGDHDGAVADLRKLLAGPLTPHAAAAGRELLNRWTGATSQPTRGS